MDPSLRYGSAGANLQVTVNAFKLQWDRNSVVSHYDGTLTPLFTGPNGKQVVLGGEKGTELIQRVQAANPNEFPHHGAFDGKKNLFSFRPFSFTSRTFKDVSWEKDSNPSRRRSNKKVDVSIVHVKDVDISLLHGILRGAEQGNPQSIGKGTDVASSLNMLQVFLQAAPRMTPGKLHKGKNLYVQRSQGEHYSRKRIDENMRPLKLLDGLFQSVRPTIGGLLVNVDVAVGVILPDMRLEELCLQYLRYRDSIQQLNQLSATHNRSNDFDRLRHFLRDVKVCIDIRGSSRVSKPKARRIRGLIRDVGSHVFDKEGVPTTIRDYFWDTYQYKIPSQSLGVSIGQYEVFPISVCKVSQQLYKAKLQPEQVREVLSFVPQNPEQRLSRITAGWQNLEYHNSAYLAGANITVNHQPLEVGGRLLPPPQIKYGQGEVLSTNNKPGTWDVKSKKFFSPATIPFVIVFNLTGRRKIDDMDHFALSLHKTMRDRGIPTRVSAIIDDNGLNFEKTMVREAQRLNVQKGELLVLALLPESAAGLYASVKRAGDIVHGVPTQCVRWSSKLVQTIKKTGPLDQYLNNLVLKINARCGGINHVPFSPAMNYLAKETTMVVGADVSHPPSGSQGPSFASLVSSRDPASCSKYTGQLNMQPQSRLELIASLRVMMQRAIKLFRAENNERKDPNLRLKRLFFFRDGVSEGEFESVRTHEVDELKTMLREAYGPDRPRLTFIIVGKRHHFRFFPRNPRNADTSGNCPSGFVVDRGIEHPVYSDFYLQSQPGLKGTSIPAHYTVIEDENLAGDGDWLQAIAYSLCHTYQRSTRSVKIPAPVYYADLVCRRAKVHFNGQLDTSDTGSDDTQITPSDFQYLHSDLHRTMHFM
ncbi:Piwi-domain-containing protein [Gymnopus androsaceus JB14]|uniref:Piwi-domain-containing protein n=1 Tax=Gymnopus androsaceus JB14 TaxID=1447944 RepID=A0A6A4H2L0_9AGAR|nr:Piwi-domain-containing protein [Gymnopus androsaceus JB14]